MDYLKSDKKKILIIDGARQIGKSYIIRETGTELFENYIEINLLEDSLNNRYFENTKSNNIQQVVIFDIIIALCIILRVF